MQSERVSGGWVVLLVMITCSESYTIAKELK